MSTAVWPLTCCNPQAKHVAVMGGWYNATSAVANPFSMYSSMLNVCSTVSQYSTRIEFTSFAFKSRHSIIIASEILYTVYSIYLRMLTLLTSIMSRWWWPPGLLLGPAGLSPGPRWEPLGTPCLSSQFKTTTQQTASYFQHCGKTLWQLVRLQTIACIFKVRKWFPLFSPIFFP